MSRVFEVYQHTSPSGKAYVGVTVSTPAERAEKKKAAHRARNARYRAKDSVKAVRAEQARARYLAAKEGAR